MAAMGARQLGAAAALVFLMAATGCQSSNAPEAAPPSSGTSLATTSMAVPRTTVPATSTTLLPTTTTTALDPESMAPCESQMAPTPIADLLFSQAGSRVPSPAPDWESPDPSSFDWNEDGTADQLIVGDPVGTVRIDWGSGSIVVRGVRTEFTDTIYDSAGNAHALLTRADEVKPAGVADVTGDGHLDLAVLNDGQLNVLTGSGPSSSSVDVAFSDLGRTTLGWQNSPQNLLNAVDLERATEDISYPVPTPISSINFVGDLTGDGIADLMAFAVLERGTGPIAFYAGTPCRTG